MYTYFIAYIGEGGLTGNTMLQRGSKLENISQLNEVSATISKKFTKGRKVVIINVSYLGKKAVKAIKKEVKK